jgi:hypothetical protein
MLAAGPPRRARKSYRAAAGLGPLKIIDYFFGQRIYLTFRKADRIASRSIDAVR